MAPGVRDDVRRGMKEIALREDENLGQLAELLLEWSVTWPRGSETDCDVADHRNHGRL
jgi:hypothetical protein